MNTTYAVHVGTCPFCRQPTKVPAASAVEATAILDWIENRHQRPHVQDAFPHLSLDDRESMISGSHGPCFDAAFAEAFTTKEEE